MNNLSLNFLRNTFASAEIRRWICILLISLASTALSQAQVEVFMRIPTSPESPGLLGDSNDTVYKGSEGWSRIRSFSLGVEIVYAVTNRGGSTSGKAGAIALDIGKEVSVVSPPIFAALAKGVQFGKLELVVRKPGTRTGEGYLKYEFGLAAPSLQKWTGSSEEPKETIRFEYSSLRMTFRPQSATGELGTPVVTTWNFIFNTDGVDMPTQ